MSLWPDKTSQFLHASRWFVDSYLLSKIKFAYLSLPQTVTLKNNRRDIGCCGNSKSFILPLLISLIHALLNVYFPFDFIVVVIGISNLKMFHIKIVRWDDNRLILISSALLYAKNCWHARYSSWSRKTSESNIETFKIDVNLSRNRRAIIYVHVVL